MKNRDQHTFLSKEFFRRIFFLAFVCGILFSSTALKADTLDDLQNLIGNDKVEQLLSNTTTEKVETLLNSTSAQHVSDLLSQTTSADLGNFLNTIDVSNQVDAFGELLNDVGGEELGTFLNDVDGNLQTLETLASDFNGIDGVKTLVESVGGLDELSALKDAVGSTEAISQLKDALGSTEAISQLKDALGSTEAIGQLKDALGSTEAITNLTNAAGSIEELGNLVDLTGVDKLTDFVNTSGMDQVSSLMDAVNSVTGTENVLGVLDNFGFDGASDLLDLSKNLDGFDSFLDGFDTGDVGGLMDLASSLGGAEGLSELTNLAGGLDGLTDLTNNFSDLGELSSLVDGIGGLDGFKDLTNLTGGLEGLTSLAENIGGLDGLGDLASKLGGVEGLTDLTNITGGLDGLTDLMNSGASFTELSSLVDSVQGLDGLSDLVNNVGGMDVLTTLTSNLNSLSDVTSLINNIGADGLANVLSQVGAEGIANIINTVGVEGLTDVLNSSGLEGITNFLNNLAGGNPESNCRSNVNALDELIKDTWILGLKQMTEQLTSTIFMQTEMIGMFFDAKLQLETQMRLQERMAQAHKDYIPSESVCKLGTMTRSIAFSDAKANTNRRAIAKYMSDRDLIQDNLSIASAPFYYMQSRIDHFRENNCEIHNNDSRGLELMCREFSPPTMRRNRDIDYTRLIDTNLTLDIDFSDKELTDDEEDLLSLGTMLFSHDTFTIPPEAGYDAKAEMRDALMEMRSILAIKSVAKDSFAYIAGTHAATDLPSGTESSVKEYMMELLREMGMGTKDLSGSQDEHIREYLGENYKPEKGNPSYHAQMELLTKKVYQDPAFITNLYDTPANVNRQQAAMRSIRMQQDWDIVKAMHRREMLLSLLLELKIRDLQVDVQSRSSETGERREIPQR